MSELRVLMGHPTLNANARQAAVAFAEAGLLRQFHTLLDTTRVATLIPGRWRQEARRRSLPPAIRPYVRSHPAVEVARLLVQRAMPSSPLSRSMVELSYAALDGALARALSDGFDAVYAYEDGALRVFRRAAAADIRRIYELPIGYWRAGRLIMQEEADINPAWASTLTALSDSRAKLDRKDEELSLASTVVVASSFTQRTLDLFPGDRLSIRRIPYGSPDPITDARYSTGGPLRVLFVGRLSQRKGISYLFDALKICSVETQLTIVGRPSGANQALETELANDGVRWHASLPHEQILQLMRSSDVLVFPSLFEGFGMVITEALSQGLPVITTPNTVGPDVLGDGGAGWVIPIRSPAAIAERLEYLSTADNRNSAKLAAIDRARSLSWESYRKAIVGAVEGLDLGQSDLA